MKRVDLLVLRVDLLGGPKDLFLRVVVPQKESHHGISWSFLQWHEFMLCFVTTTSGLQ